MDYQIPASSAPDERLALSILRKLVDSAADTSCVDVQRDVGISLMTDGYVGLTHDEEELLTRLLQPSPPVVVEVRDACRPSAAGVLWKTREHPGIGGSGAAVGDRWEHPDTGARAVATEGGWVSL